LKASAVVVMLLKIFWVAQRQFLVYDQRFAKKLHQKLMPGNNPKNFKQHFKVFSTTQILETSYFLSI
jgi:hypothetical protein